MKFSAIFYAVASLGLVQAAAINVDKRTGTPMTQAAAASKLSAAGVTWSSSGGCTDKTKKTCTSLDGILSGTVNSLVVLKGACTGCTINITGGTEIGHASGTYSHANGYKVDLAKNTALNNYVTNSYTRIADRGDGYAQWKSAAGNIYCDEGNHWDVTYY